MWRNKKPILLVIILLIFLTIFATPVWAGEKDAATAISSAKNEILNCYTAAKEAEVAGANIKVLVSNLNEAGSLLSQAELAYATNDFDAAVKFAVRTQDYLNGFIAEANTLQETAIQHRNQDFLINFVGSIVGTFAVILVGFAVWFFLKKNEMSRQK